MNSPDLTLLARDPAAFRAALLIPVGGRPARLADVMADFQRKDFLALDPALVALSRGEPPLPPRYWLERTKGASKDSDLAVSVLWLLTFSPRPVLVQIAAADQEQAGELKKCCQGIIRVNGWLSQAVQMRNWQLYNPRTESTAIILAADVASAHGSRPDLLIVNELTHIEKREFVENLFDNAAKMANGVVVAIMNAGHLNTWQADWREEARQSERWYFSAYTEPAPWLDPREVAEARRRNHPARYRRLFEGEWTSLSGDALNPEDVERSVRPGLAPLVEGEPGWAYAAGLDVGLAQDASAAVIVGKDRRGTFKLCQSRLWRPPQGGRVDLASVEGWLRDMHYRFRLQRLSIDPYQAEFLVQRLRSAGLPVSLTQFSGANLTAMATQLLDVFTSGLLSLYHEPQLLEDLDRLVIVEKSYGVRLESPRGPSGHGDLATALALALLAAKPLQPVGEGLGPCVLIAGRPPESLFKDQVPVPPQGQTGGLGFGAEHFPPEPGKSGWYAPGCEGPFVDDWPLGWTPAGGSARPPEPPPAG
jgi:hypothetical protein